MLSLDENLYQKCYCEENIYHLASKSLDLDKINDNKMNQTFVIFISSKNRCVPIWQQKMNESLLSNDNDDPVVWDYHVILLRKEININQ